jgi:arylsulfatase A-like enzyme
MNRRTFIRQADTLGAGALLGARAVGNASAAEQVSSDSPEIRNIVLFFVDQQRQDCIGCYGNDIVQTPVIDRLAASGVRFTNCYTPAPVCTPARMCLQTGLWAHTHNMMFNTGASRVHGGVDNPDPSHIMFNHVLRDRGWNLAHVGKWHIGREKDRPADHGYEDLPYYPGYGYPANNKHYLQYLSELGLDGFNLTERRQDPTGFRDYGAIQEGPQSASIPSYLANQTVDVVRRFAAEDQPFFISCNFWGPHAPYNIPRKHYEMYRGAPIEAWPNWDCDLSDKPGVIRRYGEYWKSGWFNRKDLAEMIGEYYGYITLIDEEIGRVVSTLEEAGELDRTLIVFTADHGSSVGSYRMWDKGFGMYDCITRIPLVVSHPSLAPGVSDAYTTLMDLAPTFLETAGCQVPGTMQGRSLAPVLSGEQDAVREDYIITEHHGHQKPFWQRMVRSDHWKYIYNPTDEDEWYDLDADPWETENVIGRVSPRDLADARNRLIAWMEETRDPLLRWARPML